MISKSILEFRKCRIGGSDLAAILGKSKFGGPLSVAQRIRGDKKGGDLYKPEFEFGNRWEIQVGQLFAENNPQFLVVSIEDAYYSGLLAKLPGFKARIVQLDDGSITLLDPELDFVVMNADFLIVSRLGFAWGVLEIKTASEFASAGWGSTGTDSVPMYYEDQPRFYAARMGATFVRLAVLIGQRDYREYPLSCYTKQEEEDVVDSVSSWYENHIINSMPVFASQAESKDVSITLGSLEADDQLIAKIQQHKAFTQQINALTKDMKALDDEIRAAAAEHSAIVVDGNVVFTHSEKLSETLDVEKLKRHYPNAYGECLEEVSKKRFAKAAGYKKIKTDDVIVDTIKFRQVG